MGPAVASHQLNSQGSSGWSDDMSAAVARQIECRKQRPACGPWQCVDHDCGLTAPLIQHGRDLQWDVAIY